MDIDIIEIIYNEILNYIYGIIVFKHIYSDDYNTNKNDTKKRYHIYNYRFIIIKPKFGLLYLNKNKYLMLILKKLHYINKIYYIQNKMKKCNYIWFTYNKKFSYIFII